MKKILLSLAVMAITFSVNAQTREWNLANDEANFPVTTGYSAETTIQGLTIVPGNNVTNMGATESSAKDFNDVTYKNRFKFNGGGYSKAAATDVEPTAMTPTQRYLSFEVTGKTTVSVIGVTGSSSSDRKLFVTDGTNLVGTIDFPQSTSLSQGTVTYTGGAGTLYLYCNAACNIYHIKAETVGTTGIDSSVADKGAVVSTEYYDISGRKVSEEAKGLIVQKVVYESGASEVTKTLVH